MSQIEKGIIIITYLKQYNCMQVIYIKEKYLINRISNIEKQCLKSFNWVLIID